MQVVFLLSVGYAGLLFSTPHEQQPASAGRASLLSARPSASTNKTGGALALDWLSGHGLCLRDESASDHLMTEASFSYAFNC